MRIVHCDLFCGSLNGASIQTHEELPRKHTPASEEMANKRGHFEWEGLTSKREQMVVVYCPGLLDSVVQYPTFLASGIRIRALHVQVAKRVLFESKGIGIQEDVAACKASIRFAVCGLDSGTPRELHMIVVVDLGSMHIKCQAPEACWVAWGAGTSWL